MINERLTTLETIKSLQRQEQRIHWSHAFQNLALVAVLAIGGGWFACNGGATCWAGDDAAASTAAEPQTQLPQSADSQSAESQSAESQSAESQSAESQSADSQSAESQSAESQSAATENSEPDEDDKVKWLKDHDEALARAKKLGRPVLIDFAASWCVPCVMMEKHVWPQAAVQEALESQVIPLRIDMDGKTAPELVEKYKVKFVPTILLIDAEGQELSREGFVDAEQLLEMIELSTQPATPSASAPPAP